MDGRSGSSPIYGGAAERGLFEVKRA